MTNYLIRMEVSFMHIYEWYFILTTIHLFSFKNDLIYKTGSKYSLSLRITFSDLNVSFSVFHTFALTTHCNLTYQPYNWKVIVTVVELFNDLTSQVNQIAHFSTMPRTTIIFHCLTSIILRLSPIFCNPIYFFVSVQKKPIRPISLFRDHLLLKSIYSILNFLLAC